MLVEIIFCETKSVKLSDKAKAGIKKVGSVKILNCEANVNELTASFGGSSLETIFFIPYELYSEELEASIAKEGKTNFAFWLGDSSANTNHITMEDFEQDALLATLARAYDPERSTGIKHFLAHGSTIYNESIFSLSGIGFKLDPCFHYVRTKLDASGAIAAWSGLQAAIFTAFQNIPGQGEKGTGERVDVQIGADEQRVCLSVRYDVKDKFEEVLKNFETSLVRKTANYFEVRAYPALGKVEINFIFLPKIRSSCSTQSIQLIENAKLEQADEAANYTFKSFANLDPSNTEEKRVIKGGGFKNSFSQKIKGVTENRKDEATLVKGETPKEAPVNTLNTAPQPELKGDALLLSKIEGLESTLKQREELVAKLNKEIEEIKDPLKMGVISGIKDNAAEGLKDNIKRLESEIAEAAAREKELMTVVDKAIVMKDDALKKMKDLEGKVRTLQGGNNSKVLQLEKQLEQVTKQNKDFLKKITQLTEQTQGKKAA